MGKKFKISALVNWLVPNWVMAIFQVLGITLLIGSMAKKIEAMPDSKRRLTLTALKWTEAAFFFSLAFLNLYRLIPAKGDAPRELIYFLVIFASVVITSFLCLLVNTIVTKIVEMTRMVDRGTQMVGDGSKAITETAKKAIDATQKGMAQAAKVTKDGMEASGKAITESSKKIIEATKKGAEATTQKIKEITPKIEENLDQTLKAGEKFLKENKPVIEKTIQEGSKKVAEITQKSAEATQKWTKDNAPKINKKMTELLSDSVTKVRGLFEKPGKEGKQSGREDEQAEK